MRRNNIAELREIVAKYLIFESGGLSPSLNQDFEEALRVAPDKALALALSVAFRSCETPPFPKMLAGLYESARDRRSRAELLNLLFSLLPDLPVGPFISKESKATFISAKDTENISVEKVVEVASAAESIRSDVVDAVSKYYSRQRSLLVSLDVTSRRLVLTTLASLAHRDELGGSRALEGIVRKVPTQPVTGAGSIASFEPPSPRYASVQIFRESSPGERGHELDNRQPLKESDWYQLEISVRVDPGGVPAVEERRPIREPKQSGPVDIVVTAEADGFEVEQQVSKLVLPPKGDSTEHAIFRVLPIRHSESEIDLLRIRFRLFYKFNLLEEFTVRAEVVSVLDDDAVSLFGRFPAVELYHERLRQSDCNDFDLITPACLHIHIEPHHDHYRLKFTLKHPERVDVPAFVTNVPLTAAQLEANIAGVRKSLYRVCSSDTFQRSLDGSDSEFEEHLEELSERGSDLWTLLFDPSRGEGAFIVGKWLRENTPPDGSKIQISIAGGASTFTFPWSLLYDRPCHRDSPRSERGFWGIRYVIEQRPISLTMSSRQILSDEAELEIGALYWKFAQTPEQQKYLLSLLKEAKKIKLALGKPIDEPNTAYRYLANCSSQIIYFFTHGYTGIPDGERYGVTVADFVKFYERLPRESREATRYVFEEIKQRRYKSDESFIELTCGPVKLKRLYKEVEKLSTRPLVILNMCDSAQVTPSLSQSFIEFFLSRGARAVIGTECSMRPVFADFACRSLLKALFQGKPMGEALRQLRIEAAGRRNLLGLAYTLFGVAESTLEPRLLPCS